MDRANAIDLTKRGEYPQILPKIDYYALNEETYGGSGFKRLMNVYIVHSYFARWWGGFSLQRLIITLSGTTPLAIDTRAINRMLKPN